MNTLKDFIAMPFLVIILLLLFLSFPFAMIVILIGGNRTLLAIKRLYEKEEVISCETCENDQETKNVMEKIRKSVDALKEQKILCSTCGKDARYVTDRGSRLCQEHFKEFFKKNNDTIALYTGIGETID